MLCFLPGTNEACGAYSSLHSSLPHCCVQICCSFRLLALFLQMCLVEFHAFGIYQGAWDIILYDFGFLFTSSPFGLHYASLHRCPAHPCTMLILHTKQLGWLSHHFPKRFQVFFGSFGTTLSFPCCSSNARSPSKHIQTISML